MIGMQYKIILPTDYDMGIIRKRIQENHHKTDGFPGLNFKMYLVTEAEKGNSLYNSYAPLYLWNDHNGMNEFIFEGYYDNILRSFGWQQIQIGIPFEFNINKDLRDTRYVVEYAGNIPEGHSLMNISFTKTDYLVKNAVESLGNILFYNPDKWGYSHFSFYQEKPILDTTSNLTLYEVLHVSQ